MDIQALIAFDALGVQPVTQEAYDAILLLGENGGWEDLTVSVKKTPKRKSRDEVNGDAPGGPTKGSGETGNSSEEMKANLKSKDNGNPSKKPKAPAARKRKPEQKAQNQTEDSESDLSDPPPEETNHRRVDGPLAISVKHSVPPGEAVESLTSGLRRSTRQR